MPSSSCGLRVRLNKGEADGLTFGYSKAEARHNVMGLSTLPHFPRFLLRL